MQLVVELIPDMLRLPFGTDTSDEHDNGNILFLRENHRADCEGKDDKMLLNK